MGDLPVDAVVVDLPGSSRAATLERVRGRFRGPLVILLGHGEDPTKARSVYRCSVLARPFGMSQLWSLLVDSAAEAVTEVIPAIQRHDPSQRPAPAAERPAPEPERLRDGAERPQRPAADRPERRVPAAEQSKQPAQPEPERPTRVSDRPELAPARQTGSQVFRRLAAPAGDRPREATGDRPREATGEQPREGAREQPREATGEQSREGAGPAGPHPRPGERPQQPAVPPGARPSGGPPETSTPSPPPTPPRSPATQPPPAAERSPGMLRNWPAPVPPSEANHPERLAGPVGERPGAGVGPGRGDRPAGPVEGRPERAPTPPGQRVEPPARLAAERREEASSKPDQETRKPPPWNWRSRRFKTPPPEPVDPGALTQPMPRVQPGNGGPPAPARPAQFGNGAALVAQPGEPAQREDRQDRAPAVERREAPPAPNQREAPPAPDRREAPPAPDRREAPPAPGQRERAPEPAPVVDRRDTESLPKPRWTEPATERRELPATVDPLVRTAGATASQAPASEPSRPEEVPPDPPEAVAGRLAERLSADTVALLLDNNRGLLEVAGGVGLTTTERQLQVEYGHDVLLELFRVGVGLIEDTERVRGLIRDIPGCNSQSLVMVPLVHEGHGFGALIIGRSSLPGQPRPEFTEPEIEALMDFAEDVATPLRSTVLLRRLKGQLNIPDRP
jgi:hypothetical protein